MKIVVLCEGKTEAAIKNGLRELVQRRADKKVRTGIETRSLDGHILRKKLPRLVQRYTGQPDVVGVVALTDVYPNYDDAADAKEKLNKAVGKKIDAGKFRPHAAQYEIEAWLMPFWDEIAQRLDGGNKKKPGANPEEINHKKPPSKHLQELFSRCKNPKTRYDKVIDGPKWLTADRLEQAAESCPELKAFLNSLIEFADGELIP